MYEDIAKLLVDRLPLADEAKPMKNELISSFARTIRERMGTPLLPKSSESLALSVMMPKTAALVFDRVYKIPVHIDPVPDDIGFYGATFPEVAAWAYALMLHAMNECRVAALDEKGVDRALAAKNERMSLSLITSDLGNVFGRMPTIFYHAGELHEESTKQPSVALVTVISDIALVEEEKLSWEQVLEFRRDKSARRKYRRFIRWWSHAIDSATPSQLHDDIAAKLDDYEWSLKKHGLVAATGALSCILDPKFVAGVSVAATAASMLGGGLWAALASSGLTIGRATVSISTALIEGADERHRTNGEVAYLHEVQKRLGTAS